MHCVWFNLKKFSNRVSSCVSWVRKHQVASRVFRGGQLVGKRVACPACITFPLPFSKTSNYCYITTSSTQMQYWACVHCSKWVWVTWLWNHWKNCSPCVLGAPCPSRPLVHRERWEGEEPSSFIQAGAFSRGAPALTWTPGAQLTCVYETKLLTLFSKKE